VGKRFVHATVLAGVVVLTAGSSGAGGARTTAGASARAYAIRVVVPGQVGSSVGTVSAPPDHIASGASFAYPADGSVVTTGSLTASASSDTGATGVASSSSEVQSLILFGGEIVASTVNGDARGSTKGRKAKATGNNCWCRCGVVNQSLLLGCQAQGSSEARRNNFNAITLKA